MALTIRLTKEDEKLLSKLKKQLDEPRSSQALLKAARLVTDYYPKIEKEKQAITEIALDIETDYNNLVDLLK